MAAPTFVDRIAGKFKQLRAAIVATPDSIVGTDSTGRIDVSFLPVGVGPEVTICVSSENLTAGNFVNLYLNGGIITARKADATDTTKPAHGFVLASTTSPANATVYRVSQVNTALSGLTIGSDYYLSTTPGAVEIAPGPSATGNLSQRLGIASKTTELVFEDGVGSSCEIG